MTGLKHIRPAIKTHFLSISGPFLRSEDAFKAQDLTSGTCQSPDTVQSPDTGQPPDTRL